MKKRLEGLRYFLVVAFITSFILSSVPLGISEFPQWVYVSIAIKKKTTVICMTKRRYFFRLHLLRGQHHSSYYHCIFSLISFRKKTCKILFFWVSAVSWQYKLAVCNIYVNCLGDSCKPLCEVVSYWQIVECLENVLWKVNPRGNSLKGYIPSCDTSREVKTGCYVLETFIFLVGEVFVVMCVCECVNAHGTSVFLHWKLLWV